jgi:hypothetical protein
LLPLCGPEEFDIDVSEPRIDPCGSFFPVYQDGILWPLDTND